MTKPTSYLDWVTDDDVAKITEPSGGKQALGWVAGEKPAFQFWNWHLNLIDKWIKYFESTTDAQAAQYEAIVGAGDECTHATLALALADVGVPVGSRILVKDDATINSTIQITKNNMRIEFMPGVTYTKGGVTTGIQVNAEGVQILHGRFVGFTVASDIAIQFQASGNYGHVLYTRFAAGTDTEVADTLVTAGKRPTILGTITEV